MKSYICLDEEGIPHPVNFFDIDEIPCIRKYQDNIFIYTNTQEQMNQLIEQILMEYGSKIKTVTNFKQNDSNIKCTLFSI
jgi:hypothetical protein